LELRGVGLSDRHRIFAGDMHWRFVRLLYNSERIFFVGTK
jgi:hypothetical protein